MVGLREVVDGPLEDEAVDDVGAGLVAADQGDGPSSRRSGPYTLVDVAPG
jgi:hypothetical protein